MRSRGLVSFLTSVCLMCGLIVPSNAEEQILTELQPLLDCVTSAAIITGSDVEIGHESHVSQSFVNNFVLYATSAGLVSDNAFADDSSLQEFVRSVFDTGNIDSAPDFVPDVVDTLYGVRLQDINISPDGDSVQLLGDVYMAGKPIGSMSDDEYITIKWLDKQVSAEFRCSNDSPLGWTVASFSISSQLIMDQATDEHYSSLMAEYYNEQLGFTLQYPSAFNDCLVEDESGISGQLPDDSASFFVRKENLPDASFDIMMSEISASYPGVPVNCNSAANSAKIIQSFADKTQLDVWVLGEGAVFHMQLVYSNSLSRDYSMFAEYMTNSFISLDNMVG